MEGANNYEVMGPKGVVFQRICSREEGERGVGAFPVWAGSGSRRGGPPNGEGAWAGAFIRSRVKILIAGWRKEYNQLRPHSSLGYKPPAPEVEIAQDSNFYGWCHCWGQVSGTSTSSDHALASFPATGAVAIVVALLKNS